ncbi:hypothetical protein GF367_01255 [Candidatus Woesearchaeota archaeon]|nr:hypothetical protein [Candidatus Woesearchaeota archaeon]
MGVVISDEKVFQEKIAGLRRAGSDQLHVITDFDLTLTKSEYQGRKLPSLFALIREGTYLTPDYPRKAFALYDEYRPVETDETISLEEKMRRMHEWWSRHLDIMIKSGMSRQVVYRIVHDHDGLFKDGAAAFFDRLHQRKVPLLIFSSGLGDLIKGFLAKAGLLYDNVDVIANFYSFNEQGQVTGYQSKIVHSYNKSEVQLVATRHHEMMRQRQNVLLLGDSLGDPGMVEGVAHAIVLKIGYLHDERNLDAYKRLYDVVLVNDESLAYVNDVLDTLFAHSADPERGEKRSQQGE